MRGGPGKPLIRLEGAARALSLGRGRTARWKRGVERDEDLREKTPSTGELEKAEKGRIKEG